MPIVATGGPKEEGATEERELEEAAQEQGKERRTIPHRGAVKGAPYSALRSSSSKMKNTEWMEGQLSRVLDVASNPYCA